MPRKHAVPSPRKNVYSPPKGDSVEIVVDGEHTIIIDESMAELFQQYSWGVYQNGEFAHLRSRSGKPYGHHLVVGHPPRGHVVHHRNGNRLDLRRANLEITTQRMLQVHSNRSYNTTSGVRGITANGNGWLARLRIDGEDQSKWFALLDDAKEWMTEKRKPQ